MKRAPSGLTTVKACGVRAGIEIVWSLPTRCCSSPTLRSSIPFEDDDHLVDFMMEVQRRTGALFQDTHARTYGDSLRLAGQHEVTIAGAPGNLLGFVVLHDRHGWPSFSLV